MRADFSREPQPPPFLFALMRMHMAIYLRFNNRTGNRFIDSILTVYEWFTSTKACRDKRLAIAD